MRGSLGLISLLVAVAIVIFVFSQQAKKEFPAVRTVTLANTEDVAPQAFDAARARSLAERLRSLLDVSSLPAEELRQAAATAAGWIAGTSPGSAEHHIATSLRSAAVELLAAASGGGDTHRTAARRHLESAAMTAMTNRPPDAVTGIRDQIQNLQTSRSQRDLEIDRSPE